MNDHKQSGGEAVRGDGRFERVKTMFDEARRSCETARREADIDLDYYHGEQWSAAERAELKKRRQPVITYNIVRTKIESICGVEEGTQTSPKAWPRTPRDEDAAEVATDTLRFVSDLNRFEKIRIDVLRDMLVCGTGGVIIEVEPKAGRYDIRLRKLRWETVIHDPFSRETDFSDARYLGGALWMDENDIIALYGEDARDAVESALDDAGLARESDSFSDRPAWSWADGKRRRALVAELYYREDGAWRHCVFTGGGLIRDGLSAYRDADGEPDCPIELVSAYINRDNHRYGLVRDMRSPQDEVNHRRSKLLHLLNTRQTFRREGSISARDPQALRRELNKPDGDIVLAKGSQWGRDIGIIEHGSQVSGQAELLQEAKAFLDRLGPNAGLLGRGTEDQSGRAILAQQQAGLSELATVFAAHNDWILRVYRQIWARARQFWTAPMFVRVTDEIDTPKFVVINEPVVDDGGAPVIDPSTGMPALRNRLAEMDVDLIVDRSPHVANVQSEEFRALVDLARSGVAPIPPQALIMASSIRNKQPLLDALERASQPPAPPPQPGMEGLPGQGMPPLPPGMPPLPPGMPVPGMPPIPPGMPEQSMPVMPPE